MSVEATADRVYAAQSTARSQCIPLTALVELTHRCNLNCRHCYVVADPEPELTTRELFELLDQLEAAGTLYLNLSGGEVLLREDLWEVVRYARQRNFAVGLLTNGTLLDEAAADRIGDLDVVDVGISIYGHRPELHDSVTRVPGSFEASKNALRLLAERGVTTRLKCVLMDMNVRHMDDVAALATELGALAQFDPQLGPRNDGDRTPLEDEASDEDLRRVLLGDAFFQTAEAFANEPPCSAGRDMVSISPSGEVQPCVQMPVPVGSIREKTFSEIWAGSDRLREVREFRMSNAARCGTCEDVSFCRPCIGLNIVENGSMREPASTTCRLARARKEGGQR